MLPFQRILFPIDYSEPCQAVAPYVQEMMRHFSAGLTLVHAYGPDAARSGFVLTDPDLAENMQLLEDKRLREFAKETFPGQHVECIAELGEPGCVIHKVVQHQGMDLVMLATHGHGPVRRFLLGSVAAKVLHDISAAVWTGVGTVFTGHTPTVPYESVLCAVDESEEAPIVVKAAAAFASSHRARLSLVHVVETPPASLEIDFSPYRKLLMDTADFKLRELKGELGIDVPHAVVDARVPDGIREEAVKRSADIIVTGRGRAQATFNSLWSRLYPIVRQSPCPVLSI
jgi:nucleotide-binding universal stress UspA family protein